MLSSRPIQLPTDGPFFPVKTPGRGLKNRAENAHAGNGISMTVQGKGKNVLAPKTPFQSGSTQPNKLKGLSLTVGRPLGDKTPLPNRHGTILFQTPLPGNKKLSKLVLSEAPPANQLSDQLREEEGEDEPGSLQRPSSMRRNGKHPRFSGPKEFKTPMNQGNHWDISDEEIVVPDGPTLLQETIMDDENDLDEVEYGPPNTLNLPYQPPLDFELPDYTKVGQSLRALAFSAPYADIVPPAEVDIPVEDVQVDKWDTVPLAALESDDPFQLARMEIAASKKIVGPPTHTRTSSATVTKPRPHSSLARLDTKPGLSRPTSRAAPTAIKRSGSATATSGAAGHRQTPSITSTGTATSRATSRTGGTTTTTVKKPGLGPTTGGPPARATKPPSVPPARQMHSRTASSGTTVAATVARPRAQTLGSKPPSATATKAKPPPTLDDQIFVDKAALELSAADDFLFDI